jgi:deoxycytidine triphosphate deaminase
MGILADNDIRAYLRQSKLVEGGEDKYAVGCAYNFRAGKIFTGGDNGTITDWTGTGKNEPFNIKPGAMVWIRMRNEVNLPHDIVATWWQTNSLSRKGIMLINMSVVDPGYRGPLACLFVNFGNATVPIYDTTTVAKLVFHKSEKQVAAPYTGGSDLQQYDQDLHGTALSGASSFMRVAELASDLGREQARIHKELEDDLAELRRKSSELMADHTRQLAQAKKDTLTDFAAEAPKKLGLTFAYAVAGMALLIFCLTFIPYIQGIIQPNLSGEVESIVDKRIMDRLAVTTPTSASDTQPLIKRLDALEGELRAMRKQEGRPKP